MKPSDTLAAPMNSLIDWLVAKGLEGAGQEELLDGFCTRLVDMGIPLMRFHAAQSTLHPLYGGTGYSWYKNRGGESEKFENTDTPSEIWQRSPLYALLHEDLDEIRAKLVDQNDPSRFPLLNDLRENGATDYYATGISYDRSGHVRPEGGQKVSDGVLMSWTSDAPNGFEDHDLTQINAVLPHLGLALKSDKNQNMAKDLMRIYLGRDAGRRVLSGEIRRGSLQQIDAVIWNFDLEGFTNLSEDLPGHEIIDMLNDYLAVAVGVVHDNGGNILKFMGDGLMAMFDVGEIDADARAALGAVPQLQTRMDDLNAQRRADGLPVANFTLALHSGEILYGNIGSKTRLDFTVIGPAVNQAARIAGMHRSLGQRILISDDVARAAQPCAQDLISVGRYMLRGVHEPKELFTVYTPTD
ncbi:adenylate/guanylate cyclase domain-containing protein [Rhodobacteraceae bacterium B1Z28]|uniref:Adenylate/guanylate cyclase domain-containing protein n=1 Tax=Ruegeria haliotis TaxID=2747601 RepID=A0ABX2PWR1_9RHOB|nr:adenylate/guanylate cyclase domain-containing protein [Ruegeria haliotis]NVO57542.1 adenylate/guanylate cyclase domain-containing protein [Ruegeria haliotis]